MAVAWLEAAIAFFVGGEGVELTSTIMAIVSLAFWITIQLLRRQSTKEGEVQ